MAITGIDGLVFGVEDMPGCQTFMQDWGLSAVPSNANGGKGDDSVGAKHYETIDGGEVVLLPNDSANLPAAIESGSTLRRVIFGVDTDASLQRLTQSLQDHATFDLDLGLPSVSDFDGLRVSFRVSQRRVVNVRSGVMNTAENPTARSDHRAPVYTEAAPMKIGHYVLFSHDVVQAQAFYTDVLGFVLSDYYPDAGYFLRCNEEGGHHNVFLLQTPDRKRGLNHVAFTVRDIHEVFGGGLHVARKGWSTQIGPGRHPISSAYFWYVESPTGGLFEYYADEDWCTANWEAKAWERTPEHYAEWAIAGGLDGHTRRQNKD